MVSVAKTEIIIVSPWIKQKTLKKIIDAVNPNENISWKILTRGNHDDFCVGSSDIAAFKLMIENSSIELRAIKQLHTKVYVVDNVLSLVTSANLTVSGMEINPEVGVASYDPDEISEIIEEINKWFDDAILLDKAWLKEEQKMLLEFNENNLADPPIDITTYQYIEPDNKKTVKGQYRDLPLPEDWKPLLDRLKEIDIPDQIEYLQVNDLIPAFVEFFEYVRGRHGGERLQKFLINRFFNKQSLDSVGDDKVSRERVSQKIGNRKDLPGNIWGSTEGEKFAKQVSSFLNNAIGKTDLRVSNILSSTKLEALGLSDLDLSQFIGGMIKKKIIIGSYHVEITPTNQLLVCNREIYSVLKKLDQIFHDDYREFMDLEKLCRLGELEKVVDLWFHPGFKVFKYIYLTSVRVREQRNRNVKAERRLFGLFAIGNQAADQIDQKIGRAAMTRMFNLRDILELVNDSLNDRAFT